MAQGQRFVGRSVGDRVILGCVILLAVVWLTPIAWVVILSFKSNSELMMTT
jgi:multiple sugar transport system permease protein